MSSIAIQVRNLSKKFSYWNDRPTSLKSLLVDALLFRVNRGQRTQFTALDSVTFEVKKGEFIGIMGANGAGKSTLLKILSGIYSPTTGSLTVEGKIAPLIELGAGFHGELSGYENIFLNAAILGFSEVEVRSKLDSILAFADIGDKINMPVKKYSSGMLVRLGFSVATHLNASILLVDEVLAVGDIGFQKKCLDRIKTLYQQGSTVILVTHEPRAVLEHCSRCIVIADRKVLFDGIPSEAVKHYEQQTKS
ncbi:MAG: ABC transporter ATP-binding protein [Xanthomonadaceae bacterium]|nr:ABC transporter ATP-binding protein [Xanthomonadaceae bacterium]